jgi:hypothetical protein
MGPSALAQIGTAACGATARSSSVPTATAHTIPRSLTGVLAFSGGDLKLRDKEMDKLLRSNSEAAS